MDNYLINCLCRICLDRNGVLNIQLVSGLNENICFFMGITIKANDELPQSICMKCFRVIKNSEELRTLAQKNELRLKDSIGYTLQKKQDELEKIEEPPLIKVENNIALTLTNLEEEISRCTNEDIAEPDEEKQDELDTTEELENTEEVPLEDIEKAPLIKLESNVDISETNMKEEVTCTDKNNEESDNDDPDDPPQRKRHSLTSKTKGAKKLKTKLDDEIYNCKVCGKEFTDKKKLFFHQKNHVKDFACPLDGCGKKFSYKTDLEKHIRVHTGEKPFECPVCNKKFTQRGTLKNHLIQLHDVENDKTIENPKNKLSIYHIS